MPEINRLAKLNTPESDKALTHYVLEAIRLNGTYGAYREAQRDVTVNDGGNEVHVNKGAKVFVSFISASRDPAVFPEPEKVLLDRPVHWSSLLPRSGCQPYRLDIHASRCWSLG